MKVLWVSNQIFPDFAKEIGQPIPTSCGWMYGLAKDLVSANISLTVVTTRPNIDSANTHIDGIEYFLLKGSKPAVVYDNTLESQWEDIIGKTKPNVVHIHGTEYAHGLPLIKKLPELNYVVSIQGLISVCSRYFLGGISKKMIKKNITFRDFIRQNSLLQAQKEFENRGEKVEKRYFKNVKHVIGRTKWDLNHSTLLNPQCTYHFCNESLRDSFYSSKKWDIENKTDHLIFLSQAIYPLKGLHKMLEAAALLIQDFPNLKIRVAGANITKSDSFKDKLSISGYGKYILSLITKFKLEKHIQFTGILDEKQMIQEYLNCHAFVCPSSIENSPNSLGEAQLLGTPCISSYVGGVSDMVEDGETGLLYRFEEIEMLAEGLKSIFKNDEFALKLSKNSIIVASERHHREKNLNRTMEIYSQITNNV